MERAEPWALQQLIAGAPRDWLAAARKYAFQKPVHHATLVIDSFDVPIQRQGRKRNCSSPYWSAKLNRPGWRFMVIADALMQVQYPSNGYSPKIYDGHWVQARQDTIESTFKHGIFLADGHFHEGEAFDEVQFLVPSREHPVRPEENEDPDMEKLIKWEVKRNKAIRRARARVELTIHQIKAPWKVLSVPWSEELNQLSYVMHVAAAVHNAKHNLN